MSHWTEFGFRNLPPMSSRERVTEIPPLLHALIEPRRKLLAEEINSIASVAICLSVI